MVFPNGSGVGAGIALPACLSPFLPVPRQHGLEGCCQGRMGSGFCQCGRQPGQFGHCAGRQRFFGGWRRLPGVVFQPDLDADGFNRPAGVLQRGLEQRGFLPEPGGDGLAGYAHGQPAFFKLKDVSCKPGRKGGFAGFSYGYETGGMRQHAGKPVVCLQEIGNRGAVCFFAHGVYGMPAGMAAFCQP